MSSTLPPQPMPTPAPTPAPDPTAVAVAAVVKPDIEPTPPVVSHGLRMWQSVKCCLVGHSCFGKAGSVMQVWDHDQSKVGVVFDGDTNPTTVNVSDIARLF